MLQSFTTQLKDIWSFLKEPQDQAASNLSAASKTRSLLVTLLIYISLGALFATFTMGFEKLGWASLDNHAVSGMMKAMPFWVFLLFVIIIGPFIEEVIFRYGLRFNRTWFSVFVTILLLVIGVAAFEFLPMAGAIGVILLLLATLVFYYRKEIAVTSYLHQAWPRFYGILFYLVAIVFGLVHMRNYTDFNFASAAVLLIPILIAPQIIGGLLMGYLRVKHGFSWGFYLHAGNNAFFTLVSVLFMGQLDEKLNITNDNYTLKIEEWMPYTAHNETTIFSGSDSIAYINVNLESVIVDLLHKDKSLVRFESSKHGHTFVNLNYVNKTGTKDIAANKRQVLDELGKLYKFDVLSEPQEMDTWSMAVTNSSKLAMHRVKQPKELGNISEVKYIDENIVFTNASLDQLMQNLTKEHSVMLQSDRGALMQFEDRYDFTIANKDVNELKAILADQYGISLKTDKKQHDITVIRFR